MKNICARLVSPLVVTIAAGGAAAQCGSWLPGRVPPGFDNTVQALVAHDPDGPGPAPVELIAGGGFDQAGGDLTARKIARWDGTRWHSINDGLFSTSSSVRAVASVDLDGAGPGGPRIVAGGTFGGTSSRRNIAWWDGAAWKPLDAGLNGTVTGLCAYDADGPGPGQPLLVAGGSFTGPGLRIAAWNGVAWGALGAGVNASVNAMVEFDADGPGPALPVLVAAGDFSTAGGVATGPVAVWNGSAWSGLGAGPGAVGIESLTVWDPDGAGPQMPRLIAQGGLSLYSWDGTAWTGMGGPLIGRATASVDRDGAGPLPPELYTSGGMLGSYEISRWDGAQWVVVGRPDNRPFAMAEFGGRLVVGGPFKIVDQIVPQAIAAWDGTAWSAFGDDAAPDGTVRAFEVFDPDGAGPAPAELVIGGDFIGMNAKLVNHIARWDGAAWRPLGTGITRGTSLADVRTLARFDFDGPGPDPERLVAGGRFSTAGGVAAMHVASWNGSAWSAIGAGLPDFVEKLFPFDPDGAGPAPAALFAGGANIGLWEFVGGAWVQRATLSRGPFRSMIAFDIDGPGPLPVQLVAPATGGVHRWDGAQLLPLPGSPTGSITKIGTFDPDGAGPRPAEMFITGAFTRIDLDPIVGAARWAYGDWEPLPDLPGISMNFTEMEPFDPDGDGPAPAVLAFVGPYDPAGSSPLSPRVTFWTGTRWAAAGIGLDSSAVGGKAFDADGPGGNDPLFIVGGIFLEAGGLESWRLASWSGPVAPWATDHPDDVDVTPGGTADFTMAAAAVSGPLSYRWLKDGVPLSDDGRITGSASDHLTITGVSLADYGRYSCEFSDDCAVNETFPAVLVVLCPADLSRDGQIDFGDYLEFLSLYDAQDPRVDFNGDGGVDFADYLEFLTRYDGGC